MKRSLSTKGIFKKSLKYVILITLIITVLFIGIYYTMLNYYDLIIKNYSQILVDKNEQFIQIERYEYYDGINGVSNLEVLTDTDIKEINQELKEMNKIGKNIYRLAHYIPGTGTEEAYIGKNDILKINQNSELEPYLFCCDELDIVEWDNFSDFFIDDIVGKMPDENNEIMISNHLADLIIKVGIKPYGNDDYYKPKSYKNLVTSNKYFHLGIDKVKIVGIINYDLSKYDILKEVSWIEYNSNREKYWAIGEELSDKTKKIYNKIFVNDELINHLIVNDSNIPGTSYPRYKISKTGILVIENIQKGFFSLLNKFKHDEPIAARSTYSEYVDSMETTSYWYLKRLLYPVIILVTLSVLLIIKFIIFKKDVQKLYVNKKYLCNTFIIGFISVILSSIILIFTTKFFLPNLMGEDKIGLNVFELNIRQFIALLFSMIVIITISYLAAIIIIKIINKKSNK